MHSPQRVPGAPSSGGTQLGHVSIETLVAGILATLLAIPSGLSVSLSVGGIIALILTPVTLPALWRDRRGRWLLIALLALMPSGWLVAQASLLYDRGRTFNASTLPYQAATAVSLLASIIGAYWCITKLGLLRFLLLSFAGLLVAVPFLFDLWFTANPWKYGLALPISVLAILLLARSRFLLGLVIAPLLVAVSIANDFRSWTMFVALAAVLGMYTPARSKKLSASRIASLGFAAVAFTATVGWLMVSAATSGMLGDYLEQRTNRQIEFSNGNLLLGGRPEWGAAIALWRENPLGIGLGVAPSSDDYWLAIRSMPLGQIDQQQNSGVAKYFKLGYVDFHSTFWTFWGVYGPAGVLFTALAIVYLVRSTLVATVAISSIAIRASVILLLLGAIWDILYSPIKIPQLAIAIAVALYVLGGPNIAPIRPKDLPHENRSLYQRHYNNTQ